MIAHARLYLVAPARLAAGPLVDFVPSLASAGVDLLQLREKDMEAGDVIRLAAPLRDACRSAGIPFIVNDRADVALALDADGVHVGQNDLPVDAVRAVVPDAIVGLSTHAREEIDGALTLPGVDYLSVGPVTETPSKPGRPGTGWGLVGYAAERMEWPWFVTGGMNADTVEIAMDHGARRVVVVRAIVDAPDPVVAAAQLSERLRSRPL